MRRLYVEAEERGLRETLETLIKEESWRPMEDAAQTGVLRSASELFGVIKRSLQRCSKFVSRGEPMLLLMGAFQVRRRGPSPSSQNFSCWRPHAYAATIELFSAALAEACGQLGGRQEPRLEGGRRFAGTVVRTSIVDS
jgi:hypothetical protein